ncbi:hypothetical protein YYC_00248 [Plasmodium yoelii 17X]|uniref:YIR protein n=1 Tax=Plasmodium yoelii 17X TaxID=1323249 RepID=V7PYH4_PLAYE|nr:hypothetical protein YYC_00248 [Plasmodium yoelii 17X]
MAISKLCQKFDTLRKIFPDELNGSGEYNFKAGMFKSYCPKENCNNDIDKINAVCLWLFYDLFGKYGTSIDNNYKDDIVCIMIWLSYILNLKPPDKIITLKDFYSNHIKNNTEYTNREVNDKTYGSYKDIIDKVKEYMDIDINKMSKFYELHKLLCNMYTAYTTSNSNDFSKHANKFVAEYTQLFNDIGNNIDNSSYSKILHIFSKYYNNFGIGTGYNTTSINRPSLPTQKTVEHVDISDPKETKTHGFSSGTDKQIHVATTPSLDTKISDSSLVNKLIPVLSIFAAIPIFVGIAYKYSLFGFRKRSKKQYLREKIKK